MTSPAATPHNELADDVLEWLTDSYTNEGIGTWVRFYVNHPDKRGHLLRLARTPSGGT